MKSTVLYYKNEIEGSDKVYNLNLEKRAADAYTVTFSFGRRGGTLQHGTKTNNPVPLAEAQGIYDRLIREKQSKGYVTAEGKTSLAPTPIEKSGVPGRTKYPVELLEEISREQAEHLCRDIKYWMQ